MSLKSKYTWFFEFNDQGNTAALDRNFLMGEPFGYSEELVNTDPLQGKGKLKANKKYQFRQGFAPLLIIEVKSTLFLSHPYRPYQ